MTIDEYHEEVMRTATGMACGDNKNEMLKMAAMGLCGESGEVIDLLKKHLFQGHPLDRGALLLELGDVMWYLDLAAYALGYTMYSVMQANADKLRKRYPDGFEVERSVHREAGDV